MQIYDLSASMHVYSSGCNSHYQGLTNASGKKNYSSFSCRHNSIYTSERKKFLLNKKVK